MSTYQTKQILRKATRSKDEPLNILTFPTHERYETALAKTGHNFYAFRNKNIKDWNTQFAQVPNNYHLLNPKLQNRQIPIYLDIDCVLIQAKFEQYVIGKELAKQLYCPTIQIEHTLPDTTWNKLQLNNAIKRTGDINVFISEYNKQQWNITDDKYCEVIHHAIDTNLFKPQEVKNLQILSVVNDWINRDNFCGYKIWKQSIELLQNTIWNLTDGKHESIPIRVIGDTPGLSLPAENTTELANAYAQSAIFMNTSLVSPIPMSLLEAMASGCAVVSTDTCMIPEIITNGYNGLLASTPEQFVQQLVKLIQFPDLRQKLGNNARKTIKEQFNSDTFINKWNNIFDSIRNDNETQLILRR